MKLSGWLQIITIIITITIMIVVGLLIWTLNDNLDENGCFIVENKNNLMQTNCDGKITYYINGTEATPSQYKYNWEKMNDE